MHPLPPPPPYTPSSHKQTKPSTLQIIPYKIATKKTPDTTELRSRRDQPIILRQRPERTNPIVWFGSILCLLFSLLLIFFGISTIVIFVSIKPKIPVFDVPAASLSVIYFDSPEFLNSDFTFLANFTNPNKKLKVGYEYLYFELYFSESLIATQVLQPFRQGPGEVKLSPVHLLSSLVYLPPPLAVQLEKQGQRNRVVYGIKGSFRVRAEMGMVHYSYWLHGRCHVEMTAPPNGVMRTHSCRTNR